MSNVKELVRQMQQEEGEKIDQENAHAQDVEDAAANQEDPPPALAPFVSIVPTPVNDVKNFFMAHLDLTDAFQMDKAQYIYQKILPKVTGNPWMPTARTQQNLLQALVPAYHIATPKKVRTLAVIFVEACVNCGLTFTFLVTLPPFHVQTDRCLPPSSPLLVASCSKMSGKRPIKYTLGNRNQVMPTGLFPTGSMKMTRTSPTIGRRSTKCYRASAVHSITV